ncbi:MAG: phenylacetate-CoA oxygenase subunit PaaC [Saprospiraceae bacterium]|nr:phenylacetate-CoA oxygenase subunit PaaC [Saprospiraceae bacterium]
MNNKVFDYLLLLGDSSMILGHRLSELCGHGPNLETDIALTNISLDLFGQVRNYFQYAAKLKGEEITEDKIAFLRYPNEYRNVLLVEQPNTDFAYIIARQFLFDAYHLPLMEALSNSQDETIAAVAHKSIKEVRYHHRFSSEWMKRLGDGTEESHQRMQDAVDYLWPYVGELFEETPLEAEMKEQGIGADLAALKKQYHENVKAVMEEASMQIPETPFSHSGGKKGIHSEHMGFILADLQYMQRAYPDMSW